MTDDSDHQTTIIKREWVEKGGGIILPEETEIKAVPKEELKALAKSLQEDAKACGDFAINETDSNVEFAAYSAKSAAYKQSEKKIRELIEERKGDNDD